MARRLQSPAHLWEKLRPLAREKRQAPTRAEQILWETLRVLRPGGMKFRRQHALGPYIVDFYSVQARLVIELDGSSHSGRQEEDSLRQGDIEALGLQVMRFANEEILAGQDSLKKVIERIEEAVEASRGLPLSSYENEPSRQAPHSESTPSTRSSARARLWRLVCLSRASHSDGACAVASPAQLGRLVGTPQST